MPERARAVRLLPGLEALGGYDRAWLRGDVVAGVTVAAYLVPQVMAYAAIAGLPPVAGLWATLLPLALYALLGTSRQLSPGPESSSALMTAACLAALAGTVPGVPPTTLAAVLALTVGLVCLVGWMLRLGFLASLLSRPLLIGYLAGISVLMITGQLGTMTRTTVTGATPIRELLSFVGQLGTIHWPTLLTSTAVLAALLALHRWLPRWPGPLLVVLAAAGLVAVAGLRSHGIEVVGEVPGGLPAPRIPLLGLEAFVPLLPYALGIALVGYSENVLTARAFARHERVDPGQELLALGAINLGAGVLQGFPVSSSSSRTALGNSTGSRTQLHSLVTLVMVVASLLVLGPVLGSFPKAALGGLVVYAAIRLIDPPEWRRAARFRRSEVVLAGVTALSVVAFGVLAGIGLAVALSILDLIRRIAHPHDGVLGYVPGLAGMHDVDDYPEATLVPGLLVYRYDSPLFFANSRDFIDRALRAVDTAPTPVRWFILNAEANVDVDLTAVDTLDELRSTLAGRGIVFAMARVKHDLRAQLCAVGFVERVGEERIFPTLPTAVAGYARWHREQYGHEPPGLPDDLPPLR